MEVIWLVWYIFQPEGYLEDWKYGHYLHVHVVDTFAIVKNCKMKVEVYTLFMYTFKWR